RHFEAQPRLGTGNGLAQPARHRDQGEGKGGPAGRGMLLGRAIDGPGFLAFFLSCGGRIRMFTHCA
ncbi:MAG: hypothetical protein JWN19_1407, partial [Arthrobacter sp.]|nr:hypothetical protein [Arthrobacter sp.]